MKRLLQLVAIGLYLCFCFFCYRLGVVLEKKKCNDHVQGLIKEYGLEDIIEKYSNTEKA